MPLYEVMEDREIIATDGSVRSIYTGELLRTPGPDELLVELFDEIVVCIDER